MTDLPTPRLALPLLQPGQAQKEMYHNEALARLDLAVQPAVARAQIFRPRTRNRATPGSWGARRAAAGRAIQRPLRDGPRPGGASSPRAKE